MIMERTWGSRIFDAVNITILLVVALVCFLPFVHVIAGSFATSEELLSKPFLLFPTQFSLDAFRYIFSTDSLMRSMFVTVTITVGGTLINIVLSSMTAYPLSRSDLLGRRPLMLMIVFTLMFHGGMIPQFLLIKQLGLLDSLWALMLPTAINAFYLIILRNFFQQLPAGLEESAKIDGCNDFGILLRIVFPLSLPAIATLTLFYSVMHWNTFMNAILYINDANKWPIQVLLRSIVLLSEGGIGDSTAMSADIMQIPPESVKMAVITVATLPVLMVYPFLQKYFAKGILLGSVKG
ncbi:carbohydrate ABC transporter permease [Paenibacillus chungangensis]|uniref:Carbohydrate ABC transporter permease n=1 Tax=Paenibacillus chungangensis TaxID=696535 RepID=A0ABW3HUM8_9BACL